MDNKIEILLGSKKNINSVNTDNYTKIELNNSVSEINEFNVYDVVNSTEEFNNERSNNPNYRIYGRFDYISLLNGIKSDYSELQDFFVPTYTGSSKNIINSFDFYLVKPAETNIPINDVEYIREFEVIATPDNFDIYKAGFSNNLFGEQTYSFSFNKDFDVSDYYDSFGFPVTELYLYLQYKPQTNGDGDNEIVGFNHYRSDGTFLRPTLIPKKLNIGDSLETATGLNISDIVGYNKEDFSQTQISGETVFVITSYDGGSLYLVWKFNPLIPFKLRYLSDDLNNINTGTTSYDDFNSIPAYATSIDNNGNMVWRDIVPQGYTEPLSGNGVDYPFFNGRRYLFSPIVFNVSPDLSFTNTKKVFDEISYENNKINLNITPSTTDGLDNIGKPCK